MDPIDVTWRLLNAVLAVAAGWMLVREYSHRWGRLPREDRETGSGIVWLMVTAVIAAVENSLRDFEVGPRTLSLTIALALVVVGETRRLRRGRTE